MSIDSARQRAGALEGRLGVPWLTVLPLAAVMAYADGFWMMSLRGAVGAIERTQEPFTSWWRESTLAPAAVRPRRARGTDAGHALVRAGAAHAQDGAG